MTVQAGLAVQCVAPGRAYGHPASPSPQRWRDQHGGSCRAQAPTRPPSTTISTVLHTEELSMRARAAVQGNDSAQTTTMGCRAGIAAQGSGWPGACADLLRPSPGLLAGLVVNSLVYLLGIRILRKGLTWVGYSSSWVLGTLSYAAFGYKGYLIVCLYFILGTLVTKVRMKQKEAEGIAEKRSGHRSLGSVCGSGFAGIVCAIGHLLAPQALPWQVGFVASFCSKAADTVSSEIGKAYGSQAYLVSTFRRVPRGTEGAVSLEGSLAGLAAVIGIAEFALLTHQVTGTGAGAVVVAAVLANLLESVLGATIQSKTGWLTNDVMNVIQISCAATAAMAFACRLA
ncbi:CPLD37 [Auxenochlorella protothecoides x Auxenochlorella symbiontica]|uniref:Transmembrane protein 19 n=1 Tax=Auxenochlorella protothecoides TaxID=3075 RepID=A0A1D2ACE5_AUXPR